MISSNLESSKSHNCASSFLQTFDTEVVVERLLRSSLLLTFEAKDFLFFVFHYFVYAGTGNGLECNLS